MNIQMRGTTAEILLYDDIGGFWGITADSFIREVKALKNISTINLRINSNGGSVFDGLTMYNYLKYHAVRVEVDIDGLAASIASVVALAGDEVRMADNAWMMIHDPWVTVAGTADDLRKTAGTMDGVRDTLLDTYMKRATADREAVSDLMAQETWLNASAAAELGLVDAVTKELDIAAKVREGWFKHPPEALKAERVFAIPESLLPKVEEPERPKPAGARPILAKQAQVLRRLKI